MSLGGLIHRPCTFILLQQQRRGHDLPHGLLRSDGHVKVTWEPTWETDSTLQADAAFKAVKDSYRLGTHYAAKRRIAAAGVN